jgi:rubredoxin
MAATVSYDEVAASRVCREVKGGLRWSTYFLQPPKGTRLPQAFLVENTPHRHLRTHYHDVDQFQVIVSGDGTLGRHAVRPYTIHFARAHTPYGPITAGDEGLAWLTIRARRDAEGAQFLPEKREALLHAAERNPWQLSQEPVFAPFDAAVSLQPVPGIHDERGLAAHALRMKPHANTCAPDPAATGGQYLIVLRGSVLRDGTEQRALTIGYVAPEDGPLALTAGAQGMDGLVLDFPRLELAPASASVPASARFKTWRCALCAFSYDEAQGLPEEGIAPGTRWQDVPQDWICPDCAATKADFEPSEA